MARAILSVIAGFIAMMVVVMVVFGVTMAVMGPEGAYKPGTYWTTGTFNAIVMVGSFFGAVCGGLACALIARSRRPAMVMAAIALGWGLVSAVANMQKPDPQPPEGAPSFEEGYTRGKQPNWFAFAAPLVGAGGIVLGASLRRSPPASPPPPA